MSEKIDILSEEENIKLDAMTTPLFERLESVSDEIIEAKKSGENARKEAENVEGKFYSRKQDIDALKKASIINAEGTVATLEVVEKLSKNQQNIASICNEVASIGMMDIATNRAVAQQIIDYLKGGADKKLDEEVVIQLKKVLEDLRQREDILLKQKNQGEKINEHENRIETIECRADDVDSKLEESKNYDIEQDEKISQLHQKNIEQDKRLEGGDKYDKIQDEKIEYQEQVDKKHDETLELHEKRIMVLEDRIKNIEESMDTVLINKRVLLFAVLGTCVGVAALVISIVGLAL